MWSLYGFRNVRTGGFGHLFHNLEMVAPVLLRSVMFPFSKCGFGWEFMQNGTVEQVKKIVTVLNEAEVPPEEVVGMA